MATPTGGRSSSFLAKFQSKISVVTKDGSHTKVGEPGVTTRPAPDRPVEMDETRPWRVNAAPLEKKSSMRQGGGSAGRDRTLPEGFSGGRRVKTEGGAGEGASGAPRRVRTDSGGGGGGYARQAEPPLSKEDQLAYSKKARAVEYVPYSGRDYKAQFGGDAYYQLGKLGPDLDQGELAEKRQRQERIRAFAEAVRHDNRQHAVLAPERRDKPKAPSARQKAIEFAKHVPKPKAKAAAAERGDEEGDGAGSGSEGEGDVTPLQLLALRHEQDKALVEQIRREMRIN